jgi:hypothetical protein
MPAEVVLALTVWPVAFPPMDTTDTDTPEPQVT